MGPAFFPHSPGGPANRAPILSRPLRWSSSAPQARVSRPQTAGGGFDSSGYAGRLNQRRASSGTSCRDSGYPLIHTFSHQGRRLFVSSTRWPPYVLHHPPYGNRRAVLSLGTEEGLGEGEVRSATLHARHWTLDLPLRCSRSVPSSAGIAATPPAVCYCGNQASSTVISRTSCSYSL
jgi:hypothetical protein